MKPLLFTVLLFLSCTGYGPGDYTIRRGTDEYHGVPPSYHYVPGKRAYVATGGPSNYYQVTYYTQSGQPLKRTVLYIPRGDTWAAADAYAKRNRIRYKRVGISRMNNEYVIH